MAEVFHVRRSHPEVFSEKGVLEDFEKKLSGKHLDQSLFLIKACNFIKKETLAQVFSCGFCEISKNTFSYRTPPVAASVMFSWWWQKTIIIYYCNSLLLRSFRICFSISFEDVSLLPSMLETSLVLSFTFMEWRLPERKSLVNYKKKLNSRTKIETKKIKQKDLSVFVNSPKEIRMMILNQNYDVPFCLKYIFRGNCEIF